MDVPSHVLVALVLLYSVRSEPAPIWHAESVTRPPPQVSTGTTTPGRLAGHTGGLVGSLGVPGVPGMLMGSPFQSAIFQSLATVSTRRQ